MADVTISQLSEGLPNKDTAVIPYSDGNTTYKTSPSGIVAASPGCVLKITSNTINSVSNYTKTTTLRNTWIPIFPLSGTITPLNNTSNIFINAYITGTADQYCSLRLERSIGGGAFNPVTGATGFNGAPPGSLRNSTTTSNFFYDIRDLISKSVNVQYLDTPNTNLPIIYRFTLGANYTTCNFWLNSSMNNLDELYNGISISTIALWEIAG